MDSFSSRPVSIACRLIVAGCSAAGAWCCWNLGLADYLYRLNTEQSVRAAIRVEPDAQIYYMHLAQFDDVHAVELLEKAIALDPYNAETRIELGLRFEAAGDYPKAEKLLLDAFSVDHTYLPRWSLANYYFRRDNEPAFWKWAREAAAMPSDEIAPLLELCWRISPDAGKISAAIGNDKPEFLRQYLDFLLVKGQFAAAGDVAGRLVKSGERDADRALMLSVVNQLVAANDATDAQALWRMLTEQRWIEADATTPNNANFARPPLPVSFDWALIELPGLHSWPGTTGLQTEFTGTEPEECSVAEQFLVLAPGSYTLTYSFYTTDIHPGTGIHWQIFDAKSGAVLAVSQDMSSEGPKEASVAFSVPNNESLVRLRLGYQRTLGTPRVSGILVVTSTHLQRVL